MGLDRICKCQVGYSVILLNKLIWKVAVRWRIVRWQMWCVWSEDIEM